VKTFLKSVNIWQSYKQERDCLVHFARLANTLLKDEEIARDNDVLACNFAKYSPIKKIIGRLSNKPFLLWLSTTPPRLKYVAALPRNLTFLFHKVVWQQYARCGGTFNKLHFTENLPGNLPVTKILKIGSDFTELWP